MKYKWSSAVFTILSIAVVPAVTHAQELRGRTTQSGTIINVGSRLCIEVAQGSSQEGARLQQGECRNGQGEWEVRELGNNEFAIQNRSSGLVMDVQQASAQDGATILQSIRTRLRDKAFKTELVMPDKVFEDKLELKENLTTQINSIIATVNVAGTNLKNELKDLNTELLQFTTPPPELAPNGYVLRVPVGSAQNFYQRYAQLTPEEKRPWMLHTVERGESLRSIARTYGLTTEQLASYNNIDADNKVKRGTRIRVPMTVMSPSAVDWHSTMWFPTACRRLPRVFKSLTVVFVAKDGCWLDLPSGLGFPRHVLRRCGSNANSFSK